MVHAFEERSTVLYFQTYIDNFTARWERLMDRRMQVVVIPAVVTVPHTCMWKDS